jgi:hypothetical protein
MKQIEKDYYTAMMAAYATWQEVHTRYVRELEKETDIKSLADSVYMLKELQKILEDMESKVRGTVTVAERVFCIVWAKSEDFDSVRTEHCTATAKIKQSASLPKKGTEEYIRLLSEFFKVPKELVELDAVRPHWPGVTDLLTELAASGRPLPAGIDPTKVYHVYSVLIRKKKGITE